MKKQVTAVITASLIGLLAGCAGGPVGWGGKDEVVFQSKDRIKIQWDNLTTSEAEVRQKAVAHCGGRDVEVVDAHSSAGTFGVIRSRTWECK